MARASVQQKLSRVRPPRVHITYDVEIGDAIALKELPFVMGVLGDFSGQPAEPLPNLAERKFVDVAPDNFDEVLKKMRPRAAFSVPNRLDPKAGNLPVDLTFEGLADFDPENVAKHVEPLKQLLELRTKLSDLRGSLQGNAKFDDLLRDILKSTEKREQLSRELEERGSGDGEGDNHA